MPDDAPAFWCDAMFGGLARWLRAAGYDAAWVEGIDDAELVRRALAEGRILLTADTRLVEHGAIRSGRVRAILVPHARDKIEQLRFVLSALGLARREPRCMACGGGLVEVPKHEVMGEAPPLAYRNCDRFWRCGRCGKLLWRGTHWDKIARRLQQIVRRH